jgi:hypothetical protein
MQKKLAFGNNLNIFKSRDYASKVENMLQKVKYLIMRKVLPLLE